MQGFVVWSTPAIALLGFIVLPLLFVVSLHLWRLLGYKDANRNETGTIQRRFLSALLTCICSAALIDALTQPAESGGLTFAEIFGLQTTDLLRACVSCVGITAALFTGPIVQHLVCVASGDSFCTLCDGAFWIAARNLVMAPITEEFVFRACLIRLWVSAGFSATVICVFSPMCFAMAHAHHFLELTRGSSGGSAASESARKEQVKRACFQVGFQMFYTCLFGMFSSFLLVRTGSTVAVTLAHSFCNHQGFPDVSFFSDEDHLAYNSRIFIGGVYLLGIAAFCCLLVPGTEGFSSTFVATAAAVTTAAV